MSVHLGRLHASKTWTFFVVPSDNTCVGLLIIFEVHHFERHGSTFRGGVIGASLHGMSALVEMVNMKVICSVEYLPIARRGHVVNHQTVSA